MTTFVPKNMAMIQATQGMILKDFKIELYVT